MRSPTPPAEPWSSPSDLLWAFAAALAPIAWFGAGGIARGASFFVHPDAQIQTYAWMQKLTRSLQHGSWPWWDPNTYGGHSFAGELQAGVFYPPNILWALLPGSPRGLSTGALDALVLCHFMIAALGMFRLLRSWQVAPSGSLLGAVVFSCLGPLPLRAGGQPNIFFGLCWMPWAVWALWRHYEQTRPGPALLAGAVLGLQVLAGHAQPALHTALIFAALSLAAARPATRTLPRAAVWVALGAGLIAWPQLWLSAEYLSDAYRWVSANAPIGPSERVPFEVFTGRHILAPADLANFVDPLRHPVEDANAPYVGWVVLALVGWFVGSGRARRTGSAGRQHGPWLLALGTFGLAAAMGAYGFVGPMLYYVPLLNQVRELGRYVILFHFAVSAAAGMAFEALIAVRPAKKASRVGLAAVLATGAELLWLAWTPAMDFLPSVRARFAVASMAVLTAAFAPLRPLLPLVVALAVANDVRAFLPLVVHTAAADQSAAARFAGGPISVALEDSFGNARVDLRPNTPLPATYADAHGFQSKLGHGATMYRPYFDFLQRDWSEDGRINDLLNVRYLLTGEPRPYTLVAQDPRRQVWLYERASWFPRVFLQSQVVDRPNGPALAAAIGLRIDAYDDHMQQFSFHTRAADTAITSESAYPGWCASVNGTGTPITRASIDGRETPLRAVQVPAGNVQLTFTYRPFRSRLFGCP